MTGSGGTAISNHGTVRWCVRAVVTLAIGFGWGVESGATATDNGISPDTVRSGSLLMRAEGAVQTASGYRLAPRLSTDADIVVTGTAARVRLTQRFRNESADWVEGLYVFPLPDQAAVDHLEMRVGEVRIVGEIRERDQAKRVYETARAQGRRVALVTQERPNLFTTAFANLGPGETVDVTIEYQQPVRRVDETFSLRLPLTLTPRYVPSNVMRASADRQGSGWSADTDAVPDASRVTPPMLDPARVDAGDQRFTLNARIVAGVPLASVDSRYHRILVTPDSGGGSTLVTLADATVPLDHDLELNWMPATSARPVASMLRHRLHGDDYLMLTIYPPDPRQVGSAAVAGRELVLVVDTSGSMEGHSLVQARAALEHAIGRLTPNDRFNVIEFNSVTRALFDTSRQATSQNVGHALGHVRQMRANGGTEMAPALAAALAGRPPAGMLRQVIFITDGSVGNESALFEQIERDLRGARLFTVGIGSAPNGWFMRKAAESGRGTYTTISAQGEVAERMTALFDRIERPVLADVRIDWPEGAEVYPSVVPDIYAGEPVVVRGRVPGGLDTNGMIGVTGTLGGGPWQEWLPASDTDRDYPGVGVLWARAKIESLADEQRRGADAATIRQSIVDVALAHHLVSRFTSLVAVDKTPVRVRDALLARRQVANLVPYGQRVPSFGMPATATDAAFKRLTGVLCLFVGLVLLVNVVRANRAAEPQRVRRG